MERDERDAGGERRFITAPSLDPGVGQECLPSIGSPGRCPRAHPRPSGPAEVGISSVVPRVLPRTCPVFPDEQHLRLPIAKTGSRTRFRGEAMLYCSADANSQLHERLRCGLRAERTDIRQAVCHWARQSIPALAGLPRASGNAMAFHAGRRVLTPRQFAEAGFGVPPYGGIRACAQHGICHGDAEAVEGTADGK